ncbi:MAG: type II toxin-antitoxin system RelE/ParE family toxin [Nitrospirota bacterium]
MNTGKDAVRLLSIAEQDLLDIVTFVAADNPPPAVALADRIENDLHRLARHPYLGKIPNDERLAALGYRVLVIENYLVFYKIKGKTLLVHRILHGTRDLPSLLEEL